MGVLLITSFFVLLASAFAQLREDEESLANFNAAALPTLDECGLQVEGGFQVMIYGGTETQRREFPWLAALEYNFKDFPESNGIHCGGSVIHKRYVLTAAHCLNFRRLELAKVWLGVWKISEADTTDKDIVKTFNIEKKIPHESYVSTDKGYDIALLKLDQDITFNEYIRPICLPKADLPLPEIGVRLVTAGWGRTESARPSDVKLKVELPVTANTQCDGYIPTVADIIMCAGGEAGKDTCAGDSGGPIMKTVTHKSTGKSHWYPQGIISFGKDCGVYPGVYTRVSKFTNWILSKLSQKKNSTLL